MASRSRRMRRRSYEELRNRPQATEETSSGTEDWLDDFFEPLRSLSVKLQHPRRDALRATLSSGHSSGIIDVWDEPIAWINYRLSFREANDAWLDFCVPDERLRGRDVAGFLVDSVRIHIPPLSPVKATRLRWRGADCGLGIIDSLRLNRELNSLLASRRAPEIRVLAHSEPIACWRLAVETGLWMYYPAPNAERWGELWKGVRAVAAHLLQSSIRLTGEGR